jgi:hypothetical protein
MTVRPDQPLPPAGTPRATPPGTRRANPAWAPDPRQPPFTARPAAAPPPPAELGEQAASALAEVIPGRSAFPAAGPSAPSFDDEVRTAVSYEKGLAIKALLAIALVLLVLAFRVYFFG